MAKKQGNGESFRESVTRMKNEAYWGRVARERSMSAELSAKARCPWAASSATELAEAIESGREQDALWMLEDKVKPPASEIDKALRICADKGMRKLAIKLVEMGANPSASGQEGEKLLEQEESAWGRAARMSAPRWSAPARALLAGRVEMARWLESMALQSGSGRVWGWRGLDPRQFPELLRKALPKAGPHKEQAIEMALDAVEPKNRAEALSLCALVGIFDPIETLLLTERLESKDLKALIAPLCAWSPKAEGGAQASSLLDMALEKASAQEKGLAPLDFREAQSWARLSLQERRELAAKIASFGALMKPQAWPMAAALVSGNWEAIEKLTKKGWVEKAQIEQGLALIELASGIQGGPRSGLVDARSEAGAQISEAGALLERSLLERDWEISKQARADKEKARRKKAKKEGLLEEAPAPAPKRARRI